MKVYHAVAVAVLAVPAGPLAVGSVAQADPIAPVVSPGPVMGTVVFPGGSPGGPPHFPIGPVHGTIINPGSGGRVPGGHGVGRHQLRSTDGGEQGSH